MRTLTLSLSNSHSRCTHTRTQGKASLHIESEVGSGDFIVDSPQETAFIINKAAEAYLHSGPPLNEKTDAHTKEERDEEGERGGGAVQVSLSFLY